MGNFPESVELHALYDAKLATKDLPSDGWTEILPRTKTGPHRKHFFQLQNIEGKAYTHVKVTIIPDGGIKRVRIVGKRANQELGGLPVADNVTAAGNELGENPSADESVQQLTPTSNAATILPILPLTPEAFAPFGKVIQAYADHNAAPRGTKITPANQETASKFHKLALIGSSYPEGDDATAGISVYRCDPLPSDGKNLGWDVKVLERHPFTTQAFIPMGGAGILGKDGNGLENPGDAYLVVVAKNDDKGNPDLKTLRAFAATAAQGIMYSAAVWREYCCLLYDANTHFSIP